jgi:hypothetical protein
VFDGSGTQIHDFRPGIEPNGLFWTSAIGRDEAHIHSGNGIADVDVTDLAVPDYFNIGNALFPPAGFQPEPGVVSFRGHWSQSGDKHDFDYQNSATDEKWQGMFALNSLSTEWRGETALARYVSGPMSESTSLFAEAGFERNGFFYS